MFEFDAGKLIIIGIVALIVIGPKEFPRVMLQLGQAVTKMRRMASEFHAQFMDAMREAEVEDIKSDVARLAESAKADAGTGIDPLAQIKAELTSALKAADKPAAPIGDGNNPAIAKPGEEPLLSSVALPLPPQALADAADAGMSAATQGGPERVTDAEMQAIAKALAAEMGEAAPRHASAGSAGAHDKV
jgi:sec-independent protein translocase protein TatB